MRSQHELNILLSKASTSDEEVEVSIEESVLLGAFEDETANPEVTTDGE